MHPPARHDSEAHIGSGKTEPVTQKPSFIHSEKNYFDNLRGKPATIIFRSGETLDCLFVGWDKYHIFIRTSNGPKEMYYKHELKGIRPCSAKPSK